MHCICVNILSERRSFNAMILFISVLCNQFNVSSKFFLIHIASVPFSSLISSRKGCEVGGIGDATKETLAVGEVGDETKERIVVGWVVDAFEVIQEATEAVKMFF